jgi:hypothetical protein
LINDPIISRKYFLDQSGEIPSSANPGISGDSTLSICISSLGSGDRRAQHFREPSQYVPSGKWDWDQLGLEAGFAGNGFEQLFVGVTRGPPHSNVIGCFSVRCSALVIASAIFHIDRL